jgi:hypothetical protein
LACINLHQDRDRWREISWLAEKNWLFNNDSARWIYFVTLMLMLHKWVSDSKSDDKTPMNPPSDCEPLIPEKMH